MEEFIKNMTTTWWGILILCFVCLCLLLVVSTLLYRQFFKRFYDILLSALALIVLSPILLILIIVGAIVMKGNPFFTQLRPGKNEKIFKLIKFRTMTNARDKDGNLLPDDKRLTKYGKFLRSTSLDELPELINIFIGTMSIIGPRPLVPKYLPYYTEEERRRHDVRPGLTGLAQVNGRNSSQWEERFALDVKYIKSISLVNDIKILFITVKKVFKHENIVVRGTGKIIDFDEYRRQQKEKTEDTAKENINV